MATEKQNNMLRTQALTTCLIIMWLLYALSSLTELTYNKIAGQKYQRMDSYYTIEYCNKQVAIQPENKATLYLFTFPMSDSTLLFGKRDEE